MKTEEVFECMFTRPYAEDDYLLNDYVEYLIQRLSWHCLVRQEDMCYMINEKNPPELKNEALKILRQEINSVFSSLREYIMARMLITYRLSNISLGDEPAWWLKETLGEDDYDEFELEARKYIYNDYKRFLGKEKTDEHFRKIGLEDYIQED